MGRRILQRLEPLHSGRETEIDMIEREMEGGVVIIQPAEAHEQRVENRVGGALTLEEGVEARELDTTPPEAPKA